VPIRTRLLVWVGGLALVGGAVILLRTTDGQPAPPSAPDPDAVAPPVRINQYAAANVVVPQPGERPAVPAGLVTAPAPGRLLVSWDDGRPGGVSVAGAVGYDVRWAQLPDGPAQARLVIAPDTELDGLVDGRRYRVEVRAVDAFGRRSAPAATTGVPGPDGTWRGGLTGLFVDFSEPGGQPAQVPGSHFHLSGYRGCVDLGLGSFDAKGLPIDLGCGADMAVLRARQPMRLGQPGPDGMLGRVALLTDTAGPGGELTVDLVPGPADRVGGSGRALSTPGPDPTLPPGTIRVVVNDAGAQIRSPSAPGSVSPASAPRRGPGVLHRFEVLLTTGGVRVLQDGVPIAAGGAVPSWPQAWVLLGFRGPEGQRARVHLLAVGFSGPASPLPDVAEAPVNPGTRRVLTLGAEAPAIGIARTPLVSAAAARLVATITVADGLDPAGIVVQLGDRLLPARPVTPGPLPAPGSVLTVLADVPPDLLGGPAPDTLAPFVLRAPGARDGVSVVESYLEITPGPGWSPPAQANPADTDPRRPAPDALPKIELGLGNAAGTPLTTTTVPAQGQMVLTVTLNASSAQWDSGGVAGVPGFELWLDGRIAAGVPTAAEGLGVGGRYRIALTLSAMRPGPHVLEVREFGPNGAGRPVSLLRNFVIS
jgi:hypothetical protein